MIVFVNCKMLAKTRMSGVYSGKTKRAVSFPGPVEGHREPSLQNHRHEETTMQLTTPKLFREILIFLAALFAVSGAIGQEKYPQRPIEFVVPWGPGGGADQLARKLGKLLEADLKTSFPVINVPGATGNTGMTKLLSGQSDGYAMAILIGDTAATLVAGGARWKLADVTPLAIAIRQPSGLFVKADSRFKTWNDVVAEAKAKPGTLKVAILGFGSADDITLNFLAGKGIKMIGVPFASPGERYSSILGGHADLLFEQAGDIHSFLNSKQMRPLISFGEERMEEFPDVPSSKEAGLEIYLPQFRSLVMKAGTDPQRVKLVADAIARAVKNRGVHGLPQGVDGAQGQLPRRRRGAELHRRRNRHHAEVRPQEVRRPPPDANRHAEPPAARFALHRGATGRDVPLPGGGAHRFSGGAGTDRAGLLAQVHPGAARAGLRL
jgi:tripartite-type tricarboxylate transporter receptor subunit TctC